MTECTIYYCITCDQRISDPLSHLSDGEIHKIVIDGTRTTV
jgi:hypothetical protein